MITISDIDQHLTRQGNFCLIDWLLVQNILLYPHYEAWRYGKQAHLDDALQIDHVSLQALLSDVENHCNALGLCSETQDFHHWGSERPNLLSASKNRDTHHQFTRQWLKPQDRPQLDLFMDNAAVVAENHLCGALAGRQFDLAGEHLNILAELNAQHPQLGGYRDLINYGQHMLANSQMEAEQITTELNGLQQEVLPLAVEILGQSARDYLAFAWRRLADNLTGIAFDPENPQYHRSFALEQIPDWPGVQQCLIDDPLLYRQPPLLERLALSCNALQQNEKGLLLWCILFEQHSDYASEAIGRHAYLAVNDLWQDFWEMEEMLNETLQSAWFSAFILARQPGLIHHLRQITPFAHPASKAMVDVLQARLTGADEIPAREQLMSVHPALLRMYQEEQTITGKRPQTANTNRDARHLC